MDPASAFELALTGLSTKDIDNPDAPSEELGESHLENGISQLQPKKEEESDDIILSALINAGLTPSSLPETKQSALTNTAGRMSQGFSPSSASLRVLNVNSGKVLKVLPTNKTNSSKISLIRDDKLPNIIRKRSSNCDFNQKPFKLLKSNATIDLTNNNGATWKTENTTLRNVGSKNPHFPNYRMNIVKPYTMKRDDDLEEDQDDLAQAETYADYMPQKLRRGVPHPDAVVESSSLSSVSSPDVRYQVKLPPEVIEDGLISSNQLEAVVYASQRHECVLPNGQRAGFLVGDGAGVGKGRTIAAILYENYLHKRKKALWLSVSNDLRVDAERDLRDVGLSKMKVHSLNKFKYARISGKTNGRVKKGVIFSTYSSLIGESQGGAKAEYKTRLKQLVHWCGENFDGLIVFDECHRAKNLTPSGSQKPTKTGLTVLELQNRLPNARIVYASATGASEPRNMAYMTRLGLWGEGTPFKNFNDFISTLEGRGVGAMELVAMDMKLRGMYLARQLSFKGVEFKIQDVPIEEVYIDDEPFIHVYNQSADLWVYTYKLFTEACRIQHVAEKYRKTMWGQFWSAHQRFFKYLCIAAKIDACVDLTKRAVRDGKCVVIGLQTTGEAKTLEMVEELGADLGDFVSTAKGVFQSLVDKYFPTQMNIDNFSQRGEKNASIGDKSSSTTLSRAGRAIAGGLGSGLGLKDILGEKALAKLAAGGSLSGSGFDEDGEATSGAKKRSHSNASDDSDADTDQESESEDQESDVESLNGVGVAGGSSSSDYYDSDLELNSKSNRSTKSKKSHKSHVSSSSNSRRKQKHVETEWDDEECDPDAMFDQFLARKKAWDTETKIIGNSRNSLLNDESTRELSNKYLFGSNSFTNKLSNQVGNNIHNVEDSNRHCVEMQNLLLKFIDKLGSKLPPSSLDELIDKLGGPSKVAEMTGRKGRVVMDDKGRIAYESRREADVNLEILNLTEKQRFMDGEKLIAIISEAASSGISLQADRRALNQRRRVHITLELPWSADRAIQQFGRTHRSNQVSSPQYIFLISDLAGEQRFASTVAKRLESLGALTHGDRRATDTRDLSRFNIDNKFGRDALDIVLKSCMHSEEGVVFPPKDYFSEGQQESDSSKLSAAERASRFFADVNASLQGVGLLTDRGRDRDSNQMSKFLNRILGMRVNIQNALFRYFSDTLEELIKRAKREKRLDLGIMDLCITGQNLEIVWTKSFETKFLSDSTNVNLHKVTTQRGMSWTAAMEIYREHDGNADGFYVLKNTLSEAIVNLPVLAIYAKTRGSTYNAAEQKTKENKYYRIFRPNTGQQARNIELEKLLEKYVRVKDPADCMGDWQSVYNESATKCIHLVQFGHCIRSSNFNNGVIRNSCDVGLRTRSYYILSGSVLNVWGYIEPLVQMRGMTSAVFNSQCMQVVRLKPEDSKRIVGSLIPAERVDDVLSLLQKMQDDPTAEFWQPQNAIVSSAKNSVFPAIDSKPMNSPIGNRVKPAYGNFTSTLSSSSSPYSRMYQSPSMPNLQMNAKFSNTRYLPETVPPIMSPDISSRNLFSNNNKPINTPLTSIKPYSPSSPYGHQHNEIKPIRRSPYTSLSSIGQQYQQEASRIACDIASESASALVKSQFESVRPVTKASPSTTDVKTSLMNSAQSIAPKKFTNIKIKWKEG